MRKCVNQYNITWSYRITNKALYCVTNISNLFSELISKSWQFAIQHSVLAMHGTFLASGNNDDLWWCSHSHLTNHKSDALTTAHNHPQHLKDSALNVVYIYQEERCFVNVWTIRLCATIFKYNHCRCQT